MKAATQGWVGAGPPGCRRLLMVDGKLLEEEGREPSQASQQESTGVGRAVGRGQRGVGWRGRGVSNKYHTQHWRGVHGVGVGQARAGPRCAQRARLPPASAR